MEKAVLVFVVLMIGILGLGIMKRLSLFIGECHKQMEPSIDAGEDVIRIACENPIMLSCVTNALEEIAKEFEQTTFCFYTGGKKEIRRMLEEERIDIALLMGEMGEELSGNFQKRESSFAPSALLEPFTGLPVKPIEDRRKVMYVLWNERHVTKKQLRLLSNL